jgi:DNA-binding transcriptional LysR family regulator
VRERNISRAAEEAHLTQSAVSQAVARLEKYYGCRLLERGATGVYPTALGEVAVERLDQALERLRGASQKACLARSGRRVGNAAPDRMMTLSQLAAFQAAARAGGFKAGARKLGLSQPSVHRAVRQLQEILGVELLEQTSRGLVPTRAGADFVTAVALVLREIDLIVDDLDEARGRHRGRVAIGALAFGRTELVPRAVASAVRAFPDVDFLIQDGTYDQLLQGLRTGELDIIVTAGRPLPTEDVREEVLFEDTLAVVARAGHPLADRGRAEAEDLRRFPWILPREGTPTRQVCDELLDRIGGPKGAGRIETGALASVRGLLLESDRLTLLSRHQISVELKAGLLAALDTALPEPKRTIVATLRHDWKPTRVQAALLEELKAIARGWTASG